MDITKEEAAEAIRLWGEETQTATFIEEIGEFLQAWNKLRREAITKEDYVSEIADVYIMVQQMIHMHKEVFDKVYPTKLAKIRTKLARYQEIEKGYKELLEK
jgi:NTP pyrophosphatase (non-canonical NTP hydrolase)